MWQSDFCHWPLSEGSTTEIITWLDDHSRCALSVTAHRRITGPIVVDTFDQTCAYHGFPASALTDNAMVYTTRLSGGKGGRNALETHDQRRRLRRPRLASDLRSPVAGADLGDRGT